MGGRYRYVGIEFTQTLSATNDHRQLFFFYPGAAVLYFIGIVGVATGWLLLPRL